MNKWNLNGQYAQTPHWDGSTIALVSGAIGMLMAGVWWWMQSAARPQSLQRADHGRLGQAPSRSHIRPLAKVIWVSANPSYRDSLSSSSADRIVSVCSYTSRPGF